MNKTSCYYLHISRTLHLVLHAFVRNGPKMIPRCLLVISVYLFCKCICQYCVKLLGNNFYMRGNLFFGGGSSSVVISPCLIGTVRSLSIFWDFSKGEGGRWRGRKHRLHKKTRFILLFWANVVLNSLVTFIKAGHFETRSVTFIKVGPFETHYNTPDFSYLRVLDRISYPVGNVILENSGKLESLLCNY